MLEIDLSSELEQILDFYANKDGVSKSILARKAIAEYLEDREDYDLAEEASRDIGQTFSLEEVIREFGLEDKVRAEGEEATNQAQSGHPTSDNELPLQSSRRSA